MILEGLIDSKGHNVEITCLLDEPEVTSLCYEIHIKNGNIIDTGYHYVYSHRNDFINIIKYNGKSITHKDLFKIIDIKYKRYNKLKRILK